MEPDIALTFEAEVWVYSGPAAWHFVTLPEEAASMVRFVAGKAPGFGSVRVRAGVGKARWTTSLFPDRKSGSYLLPLKADIRKGEKISAGDRIAVSLTVNP